MRPRISIKGSVLPSVCPSVRMTVRLYLRPSVCPSVHMSIRMCVSFLEKLANASYYPPGLFSLVNTNMILHLILNELVALLCFIPHQIFFFREFFFRCSVLCMVLFFLLFFLWFFDLTMYRFLSFSFSCHFFSFIWAAAPEE